MVILGVALLLGATGATAGLEIPQASPRASISQTVGNTVVSIDYGSPGVKGREIWGKLVHYDQVWRTGANEATVFAVSDDVFIDGHELAAGRYSLFTVPGPRSWTVIFNRVADQWGAFDYDASTDALRIDVKPRRAAHREWLHFDFPILTMDSAEVVLHWEQIQVPFTVKTDVVKRMLQRIDQALEKGDDWQMFYAAADFCLRANVRLEQSRAWLARSIELHPSFLNLQLEASLLASEGRRSAAIRTAERAIELSSTGEQRFDTAPLERKLQEWRRLTDGE